MKEYTNHSGGAIGADSAWDDIGKEYGMVNNRHYYFGRRTPRGNVLITREEMEEGWEKVLIANSTLKRYPWGYANLLSRNWMQVKNSEAIFAVSSLRSLKEVNGGTAWAVQMAIDAGKPIHVFDQVAGSWFEFDPRIEQFVSTDTPILTKNFAGIGTRELNDKGKKAIRDCYIKTLEHVQET